MAHLPHHYYPSRGAALLKQAAAKYKNGRAAAVSAIYEPNRAAFEVSNREGFGEIGGAVAKCIPALASVSLSGFDAGCATLLRGLVQDVARADSDKGHAGLAKGTSAFSAPTAAMECKLLLGDYVRALLSRRCLMLLHLYLVRLLCCSLAKPQPLSQSDRPSRLQIVCPGMGRAVKSHMSSVRGSLRC